jgi:hypothetical protein
MDPIMTMKTSFEPIFKMEILIYMLMFLKANQFFSISALLLMFVTKQAQIFKKL